MLKSRAAVSGLLICGLALLGCGESGPTEDDEDGHPPAEMVGTWIFQSATVNGSPTPLDVAMEWEPTTAEARVHIQANGAYVFEEVDAAGGQVWFESGWVFVDTEGLTIELNVQLDSDGPANEQVPASYTLMSGVLTLTFVDAGVTTTVTATM